MSIATTAVQHLRVEASSRWDALALASRLSAYRWHLFEPTHGRWFVCVDAGEDGVPDELAQLIRTWLSERGACETVVHTTAGDVRVGIAAAAR